MTVLVCFPYYNEIPESSFFIKRRSLQQFMVEEVLRCVQHWVIDFFLAKS